LLRDRNLKERLQKTKGGVKLTTSQREKKGRTETCDLLTIKKQKKGNNSSWPLVGAGPCGSHEPKNKTGGPRVAVPERDKRGKNQPSLKNKAIDTSGEGGGEKAT